MLNKEIIKTFINDVNRKKDNIIYQTSMENAQWLKDTLIDSLQYIEQLETKIKELGKGQQSLMQSRRKWKNRYYKIRKKNKKIESDKQNLIEKSEEIIQDDKMSDREYQFKRELALEILEILKVENQVTFK